MPDWDTRLDVLRYVVDSAHMTVCFSQTNVDNLERVLEAWPRSQWTASVKEISSLTGFLLHVSFVVRAGKFCVGCLLWSAGVRLEGREEPANDISSRSASRARVVVLYPEFFADLDFWRWLFADGVATRLTARFTISSRGRPREL